MFNDYVKFLKHIDEIKERKSKLNLSKEDKSSLSNKNQKQLINWNGKINDMMKRKCSDLVKFSLKNNFSHIVLEDLSTFGKGFTRNEEFNEFKYSRLIHLLNLVTVKDIVKNIAYKKNISVSFIQPEYTSQECHKCHCISSDNRKSQELFKCINCGLECNADYNASMNIKNRIYVDVLRYSLLKMNKYGEYLPIYMDKYKLKDILSHSYDDENHIKREITNENVIKCHNFS